MNTSPNGVSLSEKQIAKVIKRCIDTFSTSWKPDNTEIIIPLTRNSDILAKIVCQDPFRSIKEGVWEVYVYADSYWDGKEPAKSAKGASLVSLLSLFVSKNEQNSQFSVKTQTPLGLVMLTSYQARKILGYFTAVSEDGYSEPMKMKVKLKQDPLGLPEEVKFAYLLLSPDGAYEAELSFGGRKIMLPLGELTEGETQD